MDEYEHYKLRIADVTREANYALWNALLTLNGVIVTVFSAVAVFSSVAKILAITIVAGSMCSAALPILNFRSTRNIYRFIGQLSFDKIESLTASQKEQNLRTGVRAHRFCNIREMVSLVILAIQSGLIFILTLSKA